MLTVDDSSCLFGQAPKKRLQPESDNDGPIHLCSSRAHVKDGEPVFRWDEGGGPLGLLLGDAGNKTLMILLRYTRCDKSASAKLVIVTGNPANSPSFQADDAVF
jgi:hypothetical protein